MSLFLTPDSPQFLASSVTRDRVGIRQASGLDCYQWLVIGGSAVARSHTGSTAKTELGRCAVPIMLPNSRLRVRTQFTITASTNSKTASWEFGGAAFFSRAETGGTIATLQDQRDICNRGVVNSQIGVRSSTFPALGGGTTGPTTGAIDTSAPKDLIIYGTLALDSETITLENWLVELLQVP